ncbi:MAG: nucleotide exchange factor GrpE [Defluviitaleaceae bacterium]|nr:nucleotide exchange factor GrpE [Defluviitaleaceae bacterium]
MRNEEWSNEIAEPVTPCNNHCPAEEAPAGNAYDDVPAEGGDEAQIEAFIEAQIEAQTEAHVDAPAPEAADISPPPCGGNTTGNSSGAAEKTAPPPIDVSENIANIETSLTRQTKELREIHKLYHTEFAGRLKKMQDELDVYREREKGRVYDDILMELAHLYNNYLPVIDGIADDKVYKNMGYMFEDIIQILSTYGVSTQKSQPGARRDTRHCQVLERVPTNNPELHDTVISSRNTGFHAGNRSFIKEMVNIYIHNKEEQQ